MIIILSWKPGKNVHIPFGPDWLQIQPQPKAIADWHTYTDVILVRQAFWYGGSQNALW